MTTDRDPPPALDATVSAPSTPPARAADASTLRPGDTLGRYVLGESVGAGGMGRVFRARDPDLGREVAIKVLHAGHDGSGGALERRLLREAQAMATLSHDNLASVYDIGVSDGRVFVAMELIDGGSLRALIADATRSWRDKLAAVIAAGRGLSAAHSAGVIHRDFKPDNVLITRSGRVKVVDFGLARAEPDATDDAGARALPADLSANLTQTGALLGTPAYMAPEQHAGETVDARADQFAFAVTAWEAVYGRRPFPTEAYSSLVAAVNAHAIVAPPRGAGAPPAIEATLRRALARAPRDRYTSMDALLGALEHALRPRRPTRWLIAGALAVAAAGGITAFALTRGDEGGARRAAPPAGVAVVERAAPAARGAPADRGARVVAREGSEPPAGSRTSVSVPTLDLSVIARAGVRGDAPERATVLRLQQARVVRLHRAQTIACYDGAGATRAGTIVIDYDLDPSGQVTDARVVDNDLGERVATCLVDGSRRWRFPATDAPTTVRLPYTFDPEGKADGDGLDLDALEGLEAFDRLDVFGGDPPGRVDPRDLDIPAPPAPPTPPPPPPAPLPPSPP